MALQRYRGKVLSKHPSYAWFRSQESKRDLFGHRTSFADANDWAELMPGDVVDFLIEDAPRGPRAADVRIVEEAA
jgi:cold shock CspA family protein